jgi:hypothetical protein
VICRCDRHSVDQGDDQMHRDLGLRLPGGSGSIKRAGHGAARSGSRDPTRHRFGPPGFDPSQRERPACGWSLLAEGLGRRPRRASSGFHPKRQTSFRVKEEREDGVAFSAAEKPPDACTPASVTGLEESIPFCVIHSPGTCFCPGSAQGRRLMGFMRGTGRPICSKRDHIVGCADNGCDGLA